MTEIQKVQNNFGVQKEVASGHSNQVGAAREMAEVQAQVVMAKQFPRNVVSCVDRIINECTRKELAEQAMYAYPRGSQIITGPSIRLAETIARNWQNIDFGIREVEQVNGESSVIAYAWDLESNVKQTKTFKVKHERKAYGKIDKLDDPRDIYEIVANNGARRVRACILGLIPGDVIDTAVRQCQVTVQQTADVTPEGIQKLLEAFAKYGVEKEHIEKRIGCRSDAIRPAQVVQLRSIYSSIKDGISKTWEWFDIEKPKTEEKKPEEVKSDLFDDTGKAQPEEEKGK